MPEENAVAEELRRIADLKAQLAAAEAALSPAAKNQQKEDLLNKIINPIEGDRVYTFIEWSDSKTTSQDSNCIFVGIDGEGFFIKTTQYTYKFPLDKLNQKNRKEAADIANQGEEIRTNKDLQRRALNLALNTEGLELKDLEEICKPIRVQASIKEQTIETMEPGDLKFTWDKTQKEPSLTEINKKPNDSQTPSQRIFKFTEKRRGLTNPITYSIRSNLVNDLNNATPFETQLDKLNAIKKSLKEAMIEGKTEKEIDDIKAQIESVKSEQRTLLGMHSQGTEEEKTLQTLFKAILNLRNRTDATELKDYDKTQVDKMSSREIVDAFAKLPDTVGLNFKKIQKIAESIEAAEKALEIIERTTPAQKESLRTAIMAEDRAKAAAAAAKAERDAAAADAKAQRAQRNIQTQLGKLNTGGFNPFASRTPTTTGDEGKMNPLPTMTTLKEQLAERIAVTSVEPTPKTTTFQEKMAARIAASAATKSNQIETDTRVEPAPKTMTFQEKMAARISVGAATKPNPIETATSVEPAPKTMTFQEKMAAKIAAGAAK
jgi:hypothetical protein